MQPINTSVFTESMCDQSPNSSLCICGKYPGTSACEDAKKRDFAPFQTNLATAGTTTRTAQPHAAHRTLQFSHPDATLLAGLRVANVFASPLASQIVQDLVNLGVPAGELQQLWPLMPSIDQLTMSQRGAGQALTLLSGDLKVKGMDRSTPTLLMGDIDGDGAQRLRSAPPTLNPLARNARLIAARSDAWVARDARTVPGAAEWPGLRTIVIAYQLSGGLAVEIQTSHDTAAQATQFAAAWKQFEAYGWVVLRSANTVHIQAAASTADATALLAALPFHPRPAQPAAAPEAPKRAVIHGAERE